MYRLLFEPLEPRQMLTAALVQDLDLASDGVRFSGYASVEMGTRLFFPLESSAHGEELWRSDGTASGTSLVKDIAPGNASSRPSRLTVAENQLFFTTNESILGMRLWRTDGTNDGTVPVFPVEREKALLSSAWISDVVAYDNMAVFLVLAQSDQLTEAQVWVSDGTNQGTQQIATVGDLRDVLHVDKLGDSIYLTGAAENWRLKNLDGELEPVRGLDEHSVVRETHVAGGKLWLDVASGTGATQLWVIDGPGTGASRVQELPDEISFRNAGSLGDEFFFTTYNLKGNVLWKSDGTTVGTESIARARYLSIVGPIDDSIYYTGQSDLGRGLFASSGIADESRLVHEVEDTIGAFATTAIIGNSIFYSSMQDISVRSPTSIWRVDAAEATLVRRFEDRVGSLSVVNGRLLFLGHDDVHGSELWISEGTSETTRLLLDVDRGTAGELLGHKVVADNKLFFTVLDPNYQAQLWVSDGQQNRHVTTLPSWPGSSQPLGAKAVFVLRPSSLIDEEWTTRFQIWSSDGTTEGTRPIFDMPDSSQSNTETLGDKMFFVYEAEDTGAELWMTDGTETGTRLLKDIVPGSLGSHPTNMVSAGQQLFFQAKSEFGVFRESELWLSDGTPEGTRQLSNAGGSQGLFPDSITAVDDQAFFVSGDGKGLWKSDGTDEGTQLVKALPFQPRSLVAAGNRLVFFATTVSESPTIAIWSSDGTASGTRQLDVLPPNSSLRDALTSGDRAYFTIADEADNVSLWSSDGTLPGTRRVHEIGRAAQSPMEAVSIGDRTFFTADDGVRGDELWVVDETSQRTFNYDIFAGSSSSTPTDLIEFQGALYFSAEDGVHGEELWIANMELPISGDIDQDGLVGFTDLSILATHFGGPGTISQGDLNGDGEVRFDDFAMLAANFGRQSQPPVSTIPVVDTVFALADDDDDEPVFVTPNSPSSSLTSARSLA